METILTFIAIGVLVRLLLVGGHPPLGHRFPKRRPGSGARGLRHSIGFDPGDGGYEPGGPGLRNRIRGG